LPNDELFSTLNKIKREGFLFFFLFQVTRLFGMLPEEPEKKSIKGRLICVQKPAISYPGGEE